MAADWQIRDKIQNRWEIHKILKGGMGIVYIVYDHEFREPFAAKTFQDEVFARNPQTAGRFTQEALTWINLDLHPNVTEARFVQNIQGKPFLFLEYVSGGDLGGWIGTSRLVEDLSQVLRFAIQFCDGMTYALSRGIKAHRDIKPQNCLVTQDNILKVTDFGLARILDDVTAPGAADGQPPEEKPGSSGLLGRLFGRKHGGEHPDNAAAADHAIVPSPSGASATTLTYMAPEQFEHPGHVDVRADIYSFGVMLFQMVTGKLPFNGESWEQFRRLHKTQPPPALNTQHPTLNTLVAACLSRDPASRPASFGVVRDQLAEIYGKLAGEPAPEPASGIELNANHCVNKGVSLAALGRIEEALECYDQAIQINSTNEGAWSGKGVSLAALRRTEEALECVNQAIQLNPGNGQCWLNTGATMSALGRTEEALECYDRALQLNPHDELAWSNKGNSLDDLRRTEEALECFDRALQLNPRFDQAWLNRGASLAALGRREEALECYNTALQLNPGYDSAWFNRGNCLDALGRRDEALESYDRALQLNPRYEQAWSNRGASLDDLGRTEEALDCYSQALQLNPGLLLVWYNKGLSLLRLTRMEEALSCFETAQQLGHPQAAQAVNICQQHLGR